MSEAWPHWNDEERSDGAADDSLIQVVEDGRNTAKSAFPSRSKSAADTAVPITVNIAAERNDLKTFRNMSVALIRFIGFSVVNGEISIFCLNCPTKLTIFRHFL